MGKDIETCTRERRNWNSIQLQNIAKQFKYVYFGQSYNDALVNGLNIPLLKEQFMFIYSLIKI